MLNSPNEYFTRSESTFWSLRTTTKGDPNSAFDKPRKNPEQTCAKAYNPNSSGEVLNWRRRAVTKFDPEKISGPISLPASRLTAPNGPDDNSLLFNTTCPTIPHA